MYYNSVCVYVSVRATTCLCVRTLTDRRTHSSLTRADATSLRSNINKVINYLKIDVNHTHTTPFNMRACEITRAHTDRLVGARMSSKEADANGVSKRMSAGTHIHTLTHAYAGACLLNALMVNTSTLKPSSPACTIYTDTSAAILAIAIPSLYSQTYMHTHARGSRASISERQKERGQRETR